MKKKRIRQISFTGITAAFLLLLFAANFVPFVNFSASPEKAVSASDKGTGNNSQVINRINFLDNPMKPYATGILTHLTTNGSTITVAALFEELNLTQNPANVTGISCNTRYFDTSTGTGGSRVIKTRRSFDTLETLTFEFQDSSTLPVIFKDSMYTTNLDSLCTDISININGKVYSRSSQDSYDEAVPVSGKKPYDLIVDFAELPDQQFSDYEQLYFHLPDGFTLPDNFNDISHTVDIDMSLGGRLKDNLVTYDKATNTVFIDWNRSDETAFNNFRGSSTAKFTLALSGNLDPSKGSLVFSTDKTLNLVQENLHNAIVEKSASYVPYQISYEIRITSDGTNQNLTLTDEMGIALENPSDITFRFEGGQHQGDADYQPTLVSNENGKFVLNIPQMDDEDVLLVNYVSKVNVDNIARSANASFDEAGNTARIVGDSDPSDNEAFAWIPDIEFSDIEKSSLGTKYYKKDGHRLCDVTWQVITNREALVSLAGSTLTDVMGEEAITYSRYAGEGITVRCYDENGDLAAVRSIPWEDLGTDIATDTSFTYHIPETDRPYKYVMEYKTSVDTADLIKQTFVTNTVTGKCGIAEAGELINPPGLDEIAVSKKATNIRSDHVTWEVKVDISNDSLDGQIKLSEAQANDKGDITDGLYRLPRVYIPSFVDADGNTIPDRNCQEALEKLEIIGLEEGERVRVCYFSGNNAERYYDSDASMWNDGVVTMTGFQSSNSERWPDNKFYMVFYKDDQQTPGLNEPADGTRRRSIFVRMTNSFPVKWANYARDYINNSHTYRPGMFTHTNWVVVNGVKATNAFNTQPTYVYKHVINNGVNYIDINPITTVTIAGQERSLVYPVYRFAVAVNGINTDEPLVIDDAFDTDLFKLFDYRDFGGTRSFVEAVDSNGNHKYNWINWVKPSFGAQSEIGWSGAEGNGPHIRANDASFTDTVVDGFRVMENDDVRAEETATGARFTFKNLEKFKKKNGQYYNFYIVDYYVVPKNVQALAELERRLHNEETKRTPITNTASFRDDETTAITYYPHKNNLEPVTKTPYRNGNVTDDKGEQHPRIDFMIEINPGRIPLNEGRNMEVRDVYSDSLSVDFRSVKIVTDPPAEVGYDYSGNSGIFVIPDNTYVRISYTATVIGVPGEGEETVPFSNTVSVNGYSANVTSTADVSISSSGEAITPEVFIFKYRANHMETGLNNAVFELLDEHKNPIMVDDQPFRMTSAYDPEIKKDGQIHLKLDQQVHGFTLLADKFYYIHEVTAPEGYYASDVYYQFKIRTDGKVNYSDREYLNGDTLNVRNSPKAINVNLVKDFAGNVKLTSADYSALSFKLEKYNETTQQWEVYGGYSNVKYTDFGTAEGGSTILKFLEVGQYRLTESGNDTVKQNHPGSQAYVHYTWEDNTSGSTPAILFNITRDHLDKADDRTVTITDTFSTETVDRKAMKKWHDPDGHEINWPKGLEVKLNVVRLDDNVPGNDVVMSVTLDGNADKNGEFIAGTASFNGLPKFKADGQTAQQYAVVEATTFKGYTTDQQFYPLNAGTVPTVINKKKSTEISVTTKWKGKPPEDASVTLRLWAYPKDGDPTKAKPIKDLQVKATLNCEEVTSTDDSEEWLVLFRNLPLTDDSDKELVYYVTEPKTAPGYDTSYPEDQTFANDTEIILNAIGDTSFSFTKQWKNTLNNQWPDVGGITLTIKRRVAGGAQDTSFSMECVMTSDSCAAKGTLPDGVTLSTTSGGAGKYVMTADGLQKYTPQGDLWEYYATETNLPGYTAAYEDMYHSSAGNVTNGGFIINTGEVYGVTVSKSVTGNFSDPEYDFTFTIHVEDAEHTPYTGALEYEKAAGPDDISSGTLQLDAGGNGTFTLRNNQSIWIGKIPGSLLYSVTEDLTGLSGYVVKTTPNGTPRTASSSSCTVYGPLYDENGNRLADQHISYVNDRNRLIATGVELEVYSSIAAFLLFTFGLAFVMVMRSRKKETDR